MIYSSSTLPQNDNVNPHAFSIEIASDALFIQKGKMIAFYGSLGFESVSVGPFDALVRASFNSPLYANDFVIVSGTGKLILGDRGNNIASYDLEDGNLTVRGANVLGFDSSLICQESTVPGYLTLLGTGRVLASSNGPVHFMEPPVRVDEDALLGWADMPSPSYRYDYGYMRGRMGALGSLVLGRTSGEERQLDFTGSGAVLIQSSEAGLVGGTALDDVIARASGLRQDELVRLQGHVQQRLEEERR